MSYLIIGGLAFLFFVLYDINSITINNKLLRSGFLLGCILLVTATAGIVYTVLNDTNTGIVTYSAQTLIFSAMAFISLLLLIYTLFFAVPFGDTYLASKPPQICTTGIYALSRHPGGLWFMSFYLFLWLALPDPVLLLGGILFSVLNLFYILLQDRLVFMKTFADYSEYKKSTPFLFPTYQSCKQCIKTSRLRRKVTR